MNKPNFIIKPCVKFMPVALLGVLLHCGLAIPTQAQTGRWTFVNYTPGGSPRAFYATGAYLYVGSTGVWRSSDDGQTWQAMSTGLPTDAGVMAFTAIGTRMFAGTTQGVWVSVDQGQHWSAASAGLPADAVFGSVIRLETGGGVLYAETGKMDGSIVNKLFRSTDQGQSWTEVKPDFIIPSGRLPLIVNGAVLYLNRISGSAGSSLVYRSVDYGQTWKLFDLGKFNSANLAFSGSVIFVATTAATIEGIWRSTDQGQNWVQVRQFFPGPPGTSFGFGLSNLTVSGTDVFVIVSGGSTPSAVSSAILRSSDLGQIWFDASPPNNPPPMSLGLYSLQLTGNKEIVLMGDFFYRVASYRPSPAVMNVSAASYASAATASGGIVAVFGAGLTTGTQAATTIPLPTTLMNTTITVKDSLGIERPAPLFYVSPGQINYQIPAGTANGIATVTINSNNAPAGTGVIAIESVVPGLFTANMTGADVAAAVVLRIKADGSRSYEAVADFDTAQNKFIPRPIDLGNPTDQVYLVLFGTGIRNRSGLSQASMKIGGTDALVTYAGAQGDFVGLDQVNGLIPRSLTGKGETEIVLTIDGQIANPVRINIK